MRLTLASIALLVFAALAHAQDGKLSLTVKETARDSTLRLSGICEIDPAARQARRTNSASRTARRSRRSFARWQVRRKPWHWTSPSVAPLEARTLTVEYGEKVEPGPEPKTGLKLEDSKEAFTVHPAACRTPCRRISNGS